MMHQIVMKVMILQEEEDQDAIFMKNLLLNMMGIKVDLIKSKDI